MKAVRLYDAMDLRVEQAERPGTPPAGFVNLDVRAAGICGSDLHNYRTGQWISRRPSTAVTRPQSSWPAVEGRRLIHWPVR